MNFECFTQGEVCTLTAAGYVHATLGDSDTVTTGKKVEPKAQPAPKVDRHVMHPLQVIVSKPSLTEHRSICKFLSIHDS